MNSETSMEQSPDSANKIDKGSEKSTVRNAASISIRTAKYDYENCASRLVARCYAERGYINNQLSARSEGAVTVCSAFHGERTLGTIAVRIESCNGLNADVVFGKELTDLRSQGAHLCEFTRLAIDQDARDNKEMLAHLFHLAYLHAHRLAGCELLVIEVNPRHVPFYRRMLGFQVRTESRLNPHVNAPAVLMTLDLGWACKQIKLYGGNPELSQTTHTLYPYFYGEVEENLMLEKIRQ